MRNHNVTRITRLIVLSLVLIAAWGCTSIATENTAVSPVISWPGDPTSTIAVTWIGRGDATIEFERPTGEVTTVNGSRAGDVAQVLIDGLQPDTAYRYRIIGDSRWYSFRTQPVTFESIQFAVIGDLQPFNEETNRTTRMAMEKVASLDPAFLVQVGDVAEVGLLRGSWEQALSALTVAAAEHPVVPAAGNHDYYYVIPSAQFFKSIFPVPYAGADTLKRDTWYSVTVGSIHIAVLDTEAGGRSFDNQIEWLARDLSDARASGASWLFLLMHRPIFDTATVSEDQKWARALLPLVADNGVTAVFWGHDHLFEHYEYAYGGNGFVFDPSHQPATFPTHFFTAGSSGARVDSLYGGFFTHRPFKETWEMYDLDEGSEVTLEFFQRPWNHDNARYDQPGIRYQDPSVYPDAASYYHYPFDSAADARAGIYSEELSRRHSDDSGFFGYTYGESSIHYLWIQIEGDRCIITAHYVDGVPGQHGTPISTPDGAIQRWEIHLSGDGPTTGK